MTENYIDHFLNHVLPELRIAVIGDIMVDRYVFGKVERISPEAPVPVNKVDHMTSVLGGAANVASNLANLDCHVFLGGLIGDDEKRVSPAPAAGRRPYRRVGPGRAPGPRDATKMRILGARQQMVRLDFEEVTPLAVTEEEQLMTWLYNCVAAGLDGIILSDYKKGVLTDSLAQSIIKEANRAGISRPGRPQGQRLDEIQRRRFRDAEHERTERLPGTACSQ
mgnify:CR=1 FL=1